MRIHFKNKEKIDEFVGLLNKPNNKIIKNSEVPIVVPEKFSENLLAMRLHKAFKKWKLYAK